MDNTYKIILVDDDQLVRIGLEAVFPFNDKGFQIVDALSDGHEAIESIRKYQPDVVITDLYMPGLDGLELIRQCRRINPDTIIVVLSCHSDLDSIKEALRLGAFDYQLKSSIADPKKAGALLDRLSAACELRSAGKTDSKEEKNSRSGKKQLVLHYLRDSAANQTSARQMLLLKGFDVTSDKLFLAALQLDEYEAIQKMVENERKLIQKIETYVDELLDMYGCGFCMYDHGGRFLLLLQVHSATAAITPFSKLLSISEKLRHCMKNQFLHSCSIYVDKGRPFERLPHSYQVLLQALNSNQKINYDTIVDLTAVAAETICVEPASSGASAVCSIQSVVNYIEQNYSLPLTLDDLAQEANFSKYHLCRKFKEVTGTGIVDYIQRFRIERAKELLRQPGNRYISSIAQEVGFNDASYFNRIFKKYTGVTPNEFQKAGKAGDVSGERPNASD